MRGGRISDIEELNIEIENDLNDTRENPFLKELVEEQASEAASNRPENFMTKQSRMSD